MTTMNLRKAIHWKAEKRDRIILLGLSMGRIPAVGFAHYLTRPQYEFYLAFLIPVIAVCWFIGYKCGILTMLFSAAVWMIADWPHVTDLKILLLNEIVRLSVFFFSLF